MNCIQQEIQNEPTRGETQLVGAGGQRQRAIISSYEPPETALRTGSLRRKPPLHHLSFIKPTPHHASVHKKKEKTRRPLSPADAASCWETPSACVCGAEGKSWSDRTMFADGSFCILSVVVEAVNDELMSG